jgi:hypothetical protein
LSTQSVREILRRLASTAVLTGALIGGIAGAAQATSVSPERPAAGHRLADGRLAAGPHASLAPTVPVQIQNERNGECLKTKSWQHAEQVRTHVCDTGIQQVWHLSSVGKNSTGNDLYRLVNSYNDMCLDVPYANQDNFTPVVQVGCWGGDNQFWEATYLANGYYQFVVQHSGKCLDISWGAAIQYGCNNSSNQRFALRAVS